MSGWLGIVSSGCRGRSQQPLVTIHGLDVLSLMRGLGSGLLLGLLTSFGSADDCLRRKGPVRAIGG